MGGTMRLGAVPRRAGARARRCTAPTASRSCPSATATATSSTPPTAAASRTPGFVCSGTVARRPPRRVHRARRPPVLGRHPGPPRVQEPARPAAPAVPRVRRRRARSGPRAATRTCSSIDERQRRSSGADRERQASASSASALVHEGHICGWSSATFEAPDGERVRARHRAHPGRGRRCVPFDATAAVVVLVRQYRAAARRATCSRSPRASATSTARHPRRPPRSELVEEVGLARRRARAARAPSTTRPGSRRARPRLPRPRPDASVAAQPHGRRGGGT